MRDVKDLQVNEISSHQERVLAKPAFRKHVLSCRRGATNVQHSRNITGILCQAANPSYAFSKARPSLAFPLEIKLKCFRNGGVYSTGLDSTVLAAFPFGLFDPLPVEQQNYSCLLDEI